MSSDVAAERRERSTERRFDKASTSVQRRDPWPRDDKTPINTVEEFADPKKAVNSKECINRVLKDEWDNYDNCSTMLGLASLSSPHDSSTHTSYGSCGSRQTSKR